ncbi:GAF domain-containing protein [Fulvivirgaceae bacterium BMA10]|uniref:GAF domain-containing protein n=1 Tax=Splendidivirga corallicola TaxID=3051826 RepID=A0ABT8KRG1_9BACT|nr:GAF domain-containing protein [Fulvivirgaceae bacterium BMA10]
MKSGLNKTISVLFIIGIAFSSYFIYKLPTDLINSSHVIDILEMDNVQPVLTRLNILIGVVFLLGVFQVITMYIKKNEIIAAAEPTALHSSNQSKIQEAELEAEDLEVSDIDEDNLEEIIQIIHEKQDHTQQKLEKILQKACNELEAVQGALYLSKKEGKSRFIELETSYAYHTPESQKIRFEYGDGLAGQVAKEGKTVNISKVPEGYITVISGLGNTTPGYLAIVPMKNSNNVIGVVEVASFKEFAKKDIRYLEQVFALATKKVLVKTTETKKVRATKKESETAK